MTINKKVQLETAFVGHGRRRVSSLFLHGLILLLALAFQSISQTVAAQDRLTKLDPEPVVVHLENGSGLSSLTVALGQGVGIPKFSVTPAVGSSNTIPASDITFAWVTTPRPQAGSEPQAGVGQTVLTGQLTVNPRVNVEPNTNYVGRVIFYWPDVTDRVTATFTVSDRAQLAFSLTPTKLDLTFLQSQPDTILIRVKNTGRTAIGKLSVSSSDLIDTETQRRLTLPEQIKDFGSTPLGPSREAELSVKVVQPHWAGSYTGTLDVVANDVSRQSIPLAVRSRGPSPARNTYWVPFILFVATLLLGYLLSNLLESWFNLGGLKRAEVLISLRKSERELTRIAEQVEKWAAPPRPVTVFAQTRIRLLQDLDELRDLYRRIPDLTPEELVAEAKRVAVSATLAAIFESAVNIALKQWPDQPEKLNAVITTLDRVPTGTDPNLYRAGLRSALEIAAKPEVDVAKARAFDASGALPDLPSPADLERRIKLMAQLERVVAAAVVFIMAYQLFYARNFAFGTLLDYLAIFLWSLGLTQMGTQLIARARSSYTPSQ
jgi:hypothetical protein